MKTHTTNRLLRAGLLPALALALCSALLFSGCAKEPLGTERTNNSAITVELLFEKDGVKVYRFYDNGRAIYYTDARGCTQWSEYHNTGKSSYTVQRRVETAQ